MKKNKYISRLFFAVLLFLIISPIKANADSSDYVIKSYDIDIVVNENNTLDITETIRAYFYVPKHGIFRKIPINNEVKRLDGTVSKNRAQISNLKVNDFYKTSRGEGYKTIKIGNPLKTITGIKEYEISYIYNLGKDPSDEYDELYFNLIGTEWDTSISNITFTITMPKEFDASKLGFSSGNLGSTDSSNIIYDFERNVISGSYMGTLDSYEGLTIRLELPEGYFVNTKIILSSLHYLMILIPLSCLLIAFVLWCIYGKDMPVIETTEFYPPEEFNSLDIGFLYHGKAEAKDVTSLLIYLANKGYIKITESDNKAFLSDENDFIITKLKDYDGTNENEKMFLEGLFTEDVADYSKVDEVRKLAEKNGIKIKNYEITELGTKKIERLTVTKSDLYDKFYVTLNKICRNVNSKENKQLIFEKNSINKNILLIIMAIISFLTIVYIPLLDFGKTSQIFFTLFVFSFLIISFVGVIIPKMPIIIRIACFVFLIPYSNAMLSFTEFTIILKEDIYYHLAFLLGVLCIFGIIYIIKILPKRTKYGREMLGRINGFKKFLEVAEKEKLEAMVMENPNYFYDILPFSYVLDISDKWIEKFESISLQAPDWYNDNSTFDSKSFGSFINTTMNSATSAMSSSSLSDSSSGGSSSRGSSGGGSSGRGSGGGGGGSW